MIQRIKLVVFLGIVTLLFSCNVSPHNAEIVSFPEIRAT